MSHFFSCKGTILWKNIFVLLSFTCVFSVSAEPKSTQELIQACSECHGESGNSQTDSIPSIAGISEYYFVDTMESFKVGKRPSKMKKRENKPETTMKKISEQLTDQEINQLANYHSKQTFIRKVQIYDKTIIEKGKIIHLQYCERCHEDSGRSAEDDAGLLAGQNLVYLTDSLEQIISGDRVLSKKMMQKINKMNKKYGQEGLKALAHYYASQI